MIFTSLNLIIYLQATARNKFITSRKKIEFLQSSLKCNALWYENIDAKWWIFLARNIYFRDKILITKNTIVKERAQRWYKNENQTFIFITVYTNFTIYWPMIKEYGLTAKKEHFWSLLIFSICCVYQKKIVKNDSFIQIIQILQAIVINYFSTHS